MAKDIKTASPRFVDPWLTKLERIEEGAKGVGTAVAAGIVIAAGAYAEIMGKPATRERGMGMLDKSNVMLRRAVTGIRPEQLPGDIWDFLGL